MYMRRIQEMARTMLKHTNLPDKLWNYEFKTAAYTMNLLITKGNGNNKTWEYLRKTIPDISHLRIFGCFGVAKIQQAENNMANRSEAGVLMIGYESNAYVLLSLERKWTTMFKRLSSCR